MKDIKPNKLISPSLVFLTAFGLYIYTLCPTVYWDDAGELIAACYTLGIPHPPGHPSYAILGWLFTLIPFGSPAYRVNLMSAFFGALTCAIMVVIVRDIVSREDRLKRHAEFAGTTAGLVSAFSLLLWDQSVVAETTTLHSFFMLLISFLAFRIDADGPDDPRLTGRLLALSFIYGLSFTNHVAGLFFVPSLALILVWRLKSRLFKPGRLGFTFLLFVVGLSVYAYLPIRSRFDPAVDWGNPETLENFIWVVTARQYSSSLIRSPSPLIFLRGLRNIFETFGSNLTVLGGIFSLAGFIRLWSNRRPIVLYGLLLILVLFSISLNSAFIYVYMLPAVLMSFIWLGVGIAVICEGARRLSLRPDFSHRTALEWSSRASTVALVFILLFVNFPKNNKRQYLYAREYGESLLSSLPEDAVLITGTADPLFISWYLQYCEDYRTDVKVITRNGLIRPGYLNQVRQLYPELDIPREFKYENDEKIRPDHIHERGDALPWYANSYFKRFYDLNFAEHPIFWEGIESNHLLMEQFSPHGLVFRILPENSSSHTAAAIPRASYVVEHINHDKPSGRVYGNHFFNYAVYWQWHNDPGKAERYYTDSLLLNPEDSRALNNLGALLATRGDFDAAFEKFSRAFQLKPNDVTSNHNLGQIFMDRGKPSEAIPYFRRALASSVPQFEDYYNLGLCYAAESQNERAIEMLARAVELKPESSEAHSSLGVTYLRTGETDCAEKFLKMAVKLEPKNVENWYNYALVQVLKNDREASSRSLATAVSIDYEATYRLVEQDGVLSSVFASLQGQSS